MPTFQYHGRNSIGDKVTGTMEGSSAEAIASSLQKQSIIPLKVVPSKSDEDRPGTIKLNIRFRQQVTLDDLLMLCRQMRALTRSGIPIVQALTGLSEISRSPKIKKALFDISARLSAGSTLANAMRAYPDIFSPMFISMVHVGENTGELEEAFSKLIDHIQMERDTRSRMKQAMRYPSFVMIAMISAIFVINLFVIPQFATVFAKAGAELPLPTRILMTTSEFMVANWIIIFGAMFISIFSFRRYINTVEGRLWWDRAKMSIPIIGTIFEKIALSRFARSFSMTYDAGVPVLQALAIVGPTLGNQHIAKQIERIRSGVERGDSLARTSAATGIFSDLVLQMVTIGEETGSLGKLLSDVADFYDEEVDYDLKGMADAIEPIILVFLGVLVLILALGVFLPMWDLGSTLNK